MKNPFPLITILKLLSEAEFLNYCSVSLDILLCKIVKKLLSVTNHLRETSLRMEVLGVLLHVLGELIDSGSKNSYLNLGRTCVSLIDLVGLDEGVLCFLRNHLFSPFIKLFPVPADARVNAEDYAEGKSKSGAIAKRKTEREVCTTKVVQSVL